MRGVNKVILIGTLGKDPETKYFQDGTAVCNFSVATSESWKDKQGQRQEKTEWHRVTAFRKLAEICGQYLGKGAKVYVEGKLQTRSYEKNGQTLYVTEIVAEEVQFLGGGQGQGQAQSQGQGQARPQQGAYNMADHINGATGGAFPDGAPDDDLIPF